MNYWIIVTNRSTEEPRVAGRQVLSRRLRDLFYGVPQRARYRNQLAAGDRAVFYLAGEGERKFVADGILRTGLLELNSEERRALSHGPAFSTFQGFFLADAKWWPSEVPLGMARMRVPLFIQCTNPGGILQGTVARIDKADYDTLLDMGIG